MSRFLYVTLALWPLLLPAQEGIPLILGRSNAMLPPALSANGRTVVFGSTISPDGTTLPTMDLYVAAADGSSLRRLTRLAGEQRPPQGAVAVSLSPDGSRAAFTALLPATGRGGEQVRVVEVASGADRMVAVDTEGCIQPLLADCPNCFFTCVNTPHLSPDGARVLYSVRRTQPFYTVNADGTGLTRLPVFTGTLAGAPQRVISRNGLVVFTSSAPMGPTFVAAAQDVHLMNLDGSNIRAVTRFGNDVTLYARNAVISADGATVVFESNRDPDTGKPGATTHIWAVQADGSRLRPLTFNVVCLALGCPQPGGSSPSISADGSLVAFLWAGQVHETRTDATNTRTLTSFRLSSALDPVISDDGSRVAFTIGPRDGARAPFFSANGAVYSVATDSTDPRPVYAPRALNQNGVTGAVVGAAPSPGGLITAFGINLASDALTVATRFPLPESLAGLSLLVNGRPAPLLAVTPWQVNAQLPADISPGAAAFQFRFTDGAMPTAVGAEVSGIAPAIFTFQVGSLAQAAVLHAGTGVLVDSAHPAKAGDVIEIYGTGLGPTEPFVAAGAPAPASPPARTSARPQVFIGNQSAEVVFSGLAPGLAGVYQVNVIVPSGMRPGSQSVRWRVGQLDSAGFGTIAVQ